MSAPHLLEKIEGTWTGRSRLFTPWTTPAEHESASTAVVSPAARGKFMQVAYTWTTGGAPHEGLLIVGRSAKGEEVTASWIDSWHQSEAFMISSGREGDGEVTVTGSYRAPTGPDWHWRTHVRTTSDGWELLMINISPEGQEDRAFHNEYRRG